MSFFDRFRKDEEEELDILEEIKEPFSFERFVEEQIVDRYHEFRRILDEQGILFFLMSPFQYRNRLLLKLTAIFLGIVLGIVPRTTMLINQAQERNAASELAQIEDTTFKIGRMKLRALESSNYKKQHVLTFLIEGETAQGVPSTVDRYEVDLFPMRGVEDAENVKYHYDIIPIDNNQRMLLMYVDNRRQDDDTGIFGLNIQIAGDAEVKSNPPLEIVLSDTQETTSLFDAEGIDLAILTDDFIASSSSRIDEAKEDLEKSMEGYELMVDRLRADGYDVETDFDFMENHVNKYLVLEGLTDESTVRSIPKEALKFEELMGDNKSKVDLEVNTAIQIGGKRYTTDDKIGDDKLSASDKQALEELRDLQAQANRVTSSLESLNSVRQQKYDNLIDLQRTLNRDIEPNKLPAIGFVAGEDRDSNSNEEPKDVEEQEDVDEKESNDKD